MAKKARSTPTRGRRVTFQTGPWKGVKDLFGLLSGLAHRSASGFIPSFVARSYLFFIAVKPFLFSSPSTDSTVSFSFLQKMGCTILRGKKMAIKAMCFAIMDSGHIVTLSVPYQGMISRSGRSKMGRVATGAIFTKMVNVLTGFDRLLKQFIGYSINPSHFAVQFEQSGAILTKKTGKVPATGYRINTNLPQQPVLNWHGFRCSTHRQNVSFLWGAV